MAVGVVAADASAQPNHVARTEVVRENIFIISAGHGRVTMLSPAQQALLGGEQCAATVDLDGAPFENHAGVVAHRADLLSVGDLCHPAADFFVVAPVGIFGPGVEAELDGQQLPGRRPGRPAGGGCAPMAGGAVGPVLSSAFAADGAWATRQEDAA